MILAIKTADAVSEIYLLHDTACRAPAKPVLWLVQEKKWEAGRNLSTELLGEVEKIVGDFDKLTGLIVFTGPGSFTGLRIGISTMNALAYGKNLPIVGVNGEDWLEKGKKRLEKGENDKIVAPEYGGEANITIPKR